MHAPSAPSPSCTGGSLDCLDSPSLAPHNRAVPASPDFRSGFVALVGAPNVGKSTLMNAWLGQSLAAVSPRPQTTLRLQRCILTLPEAQVILVDTPGFHRPRHQLGERMARMAESASADADLVLGLFDLSRPPMSDDQVAVDQLLAIPDTMSRLMALNKVDAVPARDLGTRLDAYRHLVPDGETWLISALRGDSLPELLRRTIEMLPRGPAYYPEDQVTESYERDLAAELIRAAAMSLLEDELPHCVAAHVDQYLERGEAGARIVATLFVERTSQKPIVIGRGGEMIRRIGTLARKEIEQMSGRKVYLELHVKVLPRWRNDDRSLRHLGFPQEPE
jgi:GTP-binding protein Era